MDQMITRRNLGFVAVGVLSMGAAALSDAADPAEDASRGDWLDRLVSAVKSASIHESRVAALWPASPPVRSPSERRRGLRIARCIHAPSR